MKPFFLFNYGLYFLFTIPILITLILIIIAFIRYLIKRDAKYLNSLQFLLTLELFFSNLLCLIHFLSYLNGFRVTTALSSYEELMRMLDIHFRFVYFEMLLVVTFLGSYLLVTLYRRKIKKQHLMMSNNEELQL